VTSAATLTPDLGAKLGRLLPRLATDHPGEVLAVVAALRRTLDRAGMDLHDLAARLTEAPRPVQPAPERPRPAPDRKAEHDAADMLAKAMWLHARARDRLTPKQRDFVATAMRLLTAGRGLTPKQATWLRDLHAQHACKGH